MTSKEQPQSMHSADTVAIPIEDSETVQHIIQPMCKPPSVATVLANHMDWLQYDVNQLNENLVASHTRVVVALASLREQSKYVWFALLCVAMLLVVNVCTVGWMIYLMGTLVGHVR